MKKFLLVVCLVLSLCACSKKDQDQFASFRGQSETAIYNGGEHALVKSDYSLAAKYFEGLDALYPFGAYSQRAQLEVIYAYYKSNDTPSAIAAADRYVHLYPQAPRVDYAYYMRGILGFTQGLSWLQKRVGVDPASRDISSLHQSFSSFSQLARLFPSSAYRQDSIIRMAYIRNLIARRQLEIASYYMDHKAYISAINRANDIVLHMSQSDSTEKALALMVKAYRALSLSQKATDTLALLRFNYPNTREARLFKK